MDVTPTISSAELRDKWAYAENVIAIDPGKTTGCAIYDGDSIEARTLDFWDTVALSDEFDSDTTTVLVEDPRMNPFHYGRHQGEGGAAAQAKIARHVGRNQQDAARLIEAFERSGFAVTAVRPRGGKWDRDRCQMLTGYDGSPNNQHVRDAIRLLYQEGVI